MDYQYMFSCNKTAYHELLHLSNSSLSKNIKSRLYVSRFIPRLQYKQRKNALEFILVPYWRVLKLSFASVSPSVCLSPLKFYTLFFFMLLKNNMKLVEQLQNVKNRSGLYFCCVWSTYYRESNFLTFYFLTIGFDVY